MKLIQNNIISLLAGMFIICVMLIIPNLEEKSTVIEKMYILNKFEFNKNKRIKLVGAETITLNCTDSMYNSVAIGETLWITYEKGEITELISNPRYE